MDNQLYIIDQQKCVTCYACVRICPVKAIEVGQNSENLQVVEKRCIGCGLCEEACPVDAISYRKTIEECYAILKSGGAIAALCEPSISAEFPDITDYRKFSQMLHAAGFSSVFEVSFGVDLVAKEYANLLKEFRGKYFITSLCPSVVSLVEKYYPEQVSNLAPIASPMVASAKVVKQRYNNQIKIVYIGPCVESKNEAKRYPELIDAVLTFRELREIFDDMNIKETALEYSNFDPPYGAEGELYPIPTGFLEAANITQELLSGEVTTVTESANLTSMFGSFANNIDSIKNHFNCFMCHGCLMGPGTTKKKDYQLRRSEVIKFARKRIQSLDRDEWQKHLNQYSTIDLTTQFAADDQRLNFIPEDVAEEIYKETNKDLKSNNLDCKGCGFSSCREMAIASYCGLATPDICLLNNKKTIAKQRNLLKQESDRYNKLRDALNESEAQANQARTTAQEAQESLYATIRKLPFGVVFVDRDLKVTYSNESFVELLGEEAMEINEVVPGLIGAHTKSLLPQDIFDQVNLVAHNPNESVNKDFSYKGRLLNVQVFNLGKGHLIGCIFRDLMMPEIQKEETIRRITEIIDKNLSIVQKIGFLLGESAAESERMLNSIIKTFKQPSDGETH